MAVLICAAVMLGLSYLWHGVLLNDYVDLRIPLPMYFGLASIVYLIIAFVLHLLHRNFQMREMRAKGMLVGACLGFFIYLIAFVLGVSFSQSSTTHIAVDFVWQMIEQGIGGGLLGLLYSLFSDMARVKEISQ